MSESVQLYTQCQAYPTAWACLTMTPDKKNNGKKQKGAKNASEIRNKDKAAPVHTRSGRQSDLIEEHK